MTNNPLRFTDPTGHCGKATFGDTAISVMSGDCTRRAYEAFTRADTTEGKVVSGAVMAASAVGAGAGWAGGILLAAAGGQAVAGAVAGSTTASTAAGSAATAACADGNFGNEASALYNAGARGVELAGDDLLQAVQSHGRLILQDDRAVQRLNRAGANASQVGDYIFLRPDARKIEVLEEFLHGTQMRIGLGERLTRVQLEYHVKDFMIRHQRLLGISPEDIQWLRAAQDAGQ